MVFVKGHEDQKSDVVPALRGLKCDNVPVLGPPRGAENKQAGPQRRPSLPGEEGGFWKHLPPRSEWDLWRRREMTQEHCQGSQMWTGTEGDAAHPEGCP